MDVYIHFSLLLSFAFSIASSRMIYPENDTCRTPNNGVGVCIGIKSCPYLLSSLLTRPITQEALSFLRNSQCGWEGKSPKVCCEGNSMHELPPDVRNYSGLHRLNDDGCGMIASIRPAVFSIKIQFRKISTQNKNTQAAVGGVAAKINEFPWMALLVYDVGKSTPGFLCGGSIINSRYILTAAHCVIKLPSGKKLTGVRVGEYNFKTDRDCSPGRCNAKHQEFGIEEVIPHAGFSQRTLRDDIALIRINGTINLFSNNVKTICLPVGLTVIPDKFTVTGWGVYNDRRQQSEVIQKVELPHYSQDQCTSTYKQKNINIWHKQICAGGLQGIDGCEGDSGGPLQAQQFYKNEYRTVQYGIVSFGTKHCGTPDIPGVYTRIDYYLDWILHNMRD